MSNAFRSRVTAHERLEERARAWDISVDDVAETPGSLIAYGVRRDQPVVLKIAKRPGDEWQAGETLDAFAARGAAEVYEYADGAALLERLSPGGSLARLSLSGHDDEATEILAGVIATMSPRPAGPSVATAEQLGGSFARYEATTDEHIPRQLVSEARRVYEQLCATQTRRRLLHGDLQHYNVLFDRARGWLAIDPKGVLAETEYEIGASMRNPIERPALFLDPEIVTRRIACFAHRLGLDRARLLAWTFSQAVLSAIWDIEDGLAVDATGASIALAEIVRPMLVEAR